MRARMALVYAGVKVVLREVDLRDKPALMLQVSAKATVPVLVLEKAKVLEESLDIMAWALAMADPQGWLQRLDENQLQISQTIINENDNEFKQHLDHYKYIDRFPDLSMQEVRSRGEAFLAMLDSRLQQSRYLVAERICYVDIAVFPFVRQFAHVDKTWFDATAYVYLQRWLQSLLDAKLFQRIMKKQPVWKPGDKDVFLDDSL